MAALVDNGKGQDAPPKVHDHDIIGSDEGVGETTEQAHQTAFSEEELVLERKLRVKLDLIIMPLMIWT